MLNMKSLVLLSLLTLVAGGCTRKSGDSATVRLSFANPSSSSQKSVSAQDDTTIDTIILNVTGAGIPQPIFYQWSAHSGDQSCAAMPCTIALSVPKGDGRLIQALVVKKTSVGGNSFFYKDVTVSLQGATADVELAVEALTGTTTAGDASIAGRYLNAAGSGPTSKIRVYFPIPSHPEKPEMLVDASTDMISGWFRVFSLDGVKLHYKLAVDGSDLFGGPVGVDSDGLLGSGAESARTMRVWVPAYFRSRDGGTREPEPASRAIYGWFGPGSSSKQICWYNNNEPIGDAYLDATNPSTLQWYGNATAGSTTDAYVEEIGGVRGGYATTSVDGNNLCVATGTPFVDYLSFMDRSITSHDQLLGFKGPFQLQYSGGNGGSEMITNVSSGTLTADFTFLPGAQTSALGKGVDGIDLFGRIEATSNYNDDNADYKGGGDDEVKCAALTNLARPFVFLQNQSSNVDPSMPAAATAGPQALTMSIAVNPLPAGFAAAYSSGMATVIACPYTKTASGDKIYFSSAAVNHPNNGGGGMLPATAFKVINPRDPATPALANGVCTVYRIAGINGSSSANFSPNSNLTVTSADGSVVQAYYMSPGAPCSSSTSGFAINGGSEFEFMVKSLDSGTASHLVTFNVDSLPGQDVTQNIAVSDVGTVSEEIRIRAPSSILRYSCYPISFESWDATTNLVANFGSSFSLSWMSAPGYQFYDGNAGPCTGTVPASAPIDGSHNYAAGYLRYAGVSSVVNLGLNGYGGSITGGSGIAVIDPGPVSRLAIYSNTQVAYGTCTMMQFGLEDSSHNPSVWQRDVNLILNPDANGTFYSDPGCSTSAFTATIPGGNPSVVFYYKTTGSGGRVLTINSSSPVLSATLPITVNP